LSGQERRSYVDIYGDIFIGASAVIGASVIAAVAYAIKARAALSSLLPLG
jgi:hypothetical protein